MTRWLFLGIVAAALGIGWVAWRQPRAAAADDAWRRIAPGVEWRRLSRPFGAAIVAVRTEPARVRVATGAARAAEAWLAATGAVAAINGGFFGEDGRPLGWRVGRGRTLSPRLQRDWGVFLVAGGRAAIRHTRQTSPLDAPDEAIQCGPRLVVEGRPVRLKPQLARRSGIGIQRDGRVVLAVSEAPIWLEEWAGVWGDRAGLDCVDALNLDGGGSTQLAIRVAGETVSVPGSWAVPDAIVVR